MGVATFQTSFERPEPKVFIYVYATQLIHIFIKYIYSFVWNHTKATKISCFTPLHEPNSLRFYIHQKGYVGMLYAPI